MPDDPVVAQQHLDLYYACMKTKNIDLTGLLSLAGDLVAGAGIAPSVAQAIIDGAKNKNECGDLLTDSQRVTLACSQNAANIAAGGIPGHPQQPKNV